jgi:hypothetical protein
MGSSTASAHHVGLFGRERHSGVLSSTLRGSPILKKFFDPLQMLKEIFIREERE